MTTIGKILTFALLILNLSTLGICMWLYVDNQPVKTRQAKIDALKTEITAQRTVLDDEEAKLLELLNDKRGGATSVEIQQGGKDQPFQLSPPRTVTVSEARAEIQKDQEELAKLKGESETLVAQISQIISEIEAHRAKTKLALAEQERLRLAVEKPEINGQPVQPFHILIAEAGNAERAARTRRESITPDLVNALARLRVLQQWHAQLSGRLQEVNGTARRRISPRPASRTVVGSN